jgi:hypothetical protein
MSLIHTCELCGTNSFEYLTELQRHAAELAHKPAEWMPWNYRSKLAALPYDDSVWPKRILCGQAKQTSPNADKTCLSQTQIGPRFWSDTEAAENVSGGDLCPGFHE